MGEMNELQNRHFSQDEITNLTEGKVPHKMDVSDFTWDLLTIMVHDTETGQPLFGSREEAKIVLMPKSTRVLMDLIMECGKLVSPPKAEKGIEDVATLD